MSDLDPTKGHSRKTYKVELKGGQTYVIDLQTPNFDAYLYLLDSNKQQLAADDDSGGMLNSRITHRPDNAGTFYIVATALDQRQGDFVLTVRNDSADDEKGEEKKVEEKKDKGAAEEPAKGKKFEAVDIKGALNNNDAADTVRNTPCKLHRVNLTKGKVYQIDMISADFDCYLRLEDKDGKQVAEDDDGGGDLNARITFKAPADGNYQIVATMFNDGAGNYQLKVAERKVRPLKTEALKLDDAGAATVQSKLDNNDERGYITPSTFQKVYTVKLKAGETYVIDMESTDFDAFLNVLDADERTLASDDDSGGNLNVQISFRPDADGTYLIIATGLGDPQGDYSLKIRKQ